MSKKFILLVEDNQDDVFLTLRALKKNNIANEVIVARDGVESLEFLFGKGKFENRDLNEMPVVILLDLNMPRMGGLQVLKQIRENSLTRFLPVVVLTASKEEADIVESYRLGTNAYVRKPVDFVQFAEAIRQLGLFWFVLNESAPPQSCNFNQS